MKDINQPPKNPHLHSVPNPSSTQGSRSQRRRNSKRDAHTVDWQDMNTRDAEVRSMVRSNLAATALTLIAVCVGLVVAIHSSSSNK